MRTIRELQNHEHERGAALMTVLIVMLMVAGTAAYMINNAKQQAYAVTRVRDYLQAQAIAEGGANQAYSVLKNSWAAKDDASKFPLTSYGGGTYDATVTSPNSTQASVSCVGSCGKATVLVAVDIQNFGGSSGGGGGGGGTVTGAYACGMMSGGSMTFAGNSSIVTTGRVHSNVNMMFSGNQNVTAPLISCCNTMSFTGNTSIAGTMQAKAYAKNGNFSHTGAMTTGTVATVSVPTIDTTPYLTCAQSNGQYTVGSLTLNGNTQLTPAGGVIYATSNVTVSGNQSVAGCIVAGGNITLSGNSAFAKVGGLPQLISINGTITVTGNADYHGLIYTKTGNYSGAGNGAIKGSIVTKGAISFGGNFSALVYEDSTPVAPGSGGSGGGSTADKPVPVAWQR